MDEITNTELPSPRQMPKYEIRSITINGKLMNYDPVMQRRLNAIRVLKDDGIISDKEYYILRHRIMKALEKPESLAMENDQ